MRVYVRNEIHNTETFFNAKLTSDGYYFVNNAQLERAGKKLCGMEACCCESFKLSLDDQGEKELETIDVPAGLLLYDPCE